MFRCLMISVPNIYSEFGNKVRTFINLFPRTRKKAFSWFKSNCFVQKVRSPFRSGRTRKKPFRSKSINVQMVILLKISYFARFRLILGHFGSFLGSEMFSSSKGFLVRKAFSLVSGRIRKKTIRTEKLLRKKSFLRKKTFWLEKQKHYLRAHCIQCLRCNLTLFSVCVAF